MKRLLLIIMAVFALAACKKTADTPEFDAKTQGKVRFELVKQNVYALSALDDARTIKVTLQDEEGNEIVLPSLDLTGDENLVATSYITLRAGKYCITSYRCFDFQGDLITDLDITLTEGNTFEVIAGEQTAMSLPTKVKLVQTADNIYNTLRGICIDICGEDESLWPASWNFDDFKLDETWAGLEFETVIDYTTLTLVGLIFNGEEDYIINSDTWEQRLVSTPEFRHMKMLPACVANLTEIQSIVVRNTDMERLPKELGNSFITSLCIENTNLTDVPAEVANMPSLTDIILSNNKLTSFPEAFTGVKTIEYVTIENERIASIPASIANWGSNLTALRITGTDITELPDVFDKLWHVSLPDFSDNKQLATLPPTLALENIPYGTEGNYTKSAITGIDLTDCAFTSIPTQLQRPGMHAIYMSRNKITSVTKEEIERMTDLETLVLDGNKLTSFPRLTNAHLQYISLRGTGLTRDQIDLSGLPANCVLAL